MSRSHSKARCPHCELFIELCLCTEIKPIHTQTKVVLIMHMREIPLTTNTARLAKLQLTNADLRIRGIKNEELSCEDLASDRSRKLLFLFPSEEAVSIQQWSDENPDQAATLVVPDGNWKQCSKVYKRVPGLSSVIPVKLPPTNDRSLYTLRKEPRVECFSTYEALMRALEILESRQGSEVGKALRLQMEHVFKLKIDRTQFARGNLKAQSVYEGIPQDFGKKKPHSEE